MGLFTKIFEKWLGTPNPDQYINGGPDTTGTAWSTQWDSGQAISLWSKTSRFIRSRLIRPVFVFGVYDSSSGEIKHDLLYHLRNILSPLADVGYINSYDMNNAAIMDGITIDAETKAAGTGTHTFTVTAGKIWILLAGNANNNTEAAQAYARIRIAGAGDYIYSKVKTAGAAADMVSCFEDINLPLALPASTTIQLYDAANSAGEVSVFTIMYVEIDA